MPQPYKIFTIYAREDAQYLEELRGQLRPLEIAGRIRVWSDREINPGVDWEQEIVQNLDSADIILILVSAAYYNSAYIHEKEIKYAIARHERGEAKVLPVIVRSCHFLADPVISRLQVLPADGKPVTDRRHWAERDDAWFDVVEGVKRTIDIIRDAEKCPEQETREAAEQKKIEEMRAHHAEIEAIERRQQEQRIRNEQARQEQEAEAARQREAQIKREREEQERLAQFRREQEHATSATKHQYRKNDSNEGLSIQDDIQVARLYVKREFSLVSSLRDMGVYVDGEKLGTVDNGGDVEFLIPCGRRSISVKIAGFFSDLLQVDAGKNQVLTVLAGATWLSPKPFLKVS